jgi:DNA transformation protein
VGDRGARFTELVGDQADDVVELLAPLGAVRWKRMFGGAGIFVDDGMFALIDSGGQLHLKVADANRDRYEHAGARKHPRMPYYSVPESVRGDDALLLAWARESAELAR